MNVHNLDGCAPVPLAHYLKALGILRLVSEQADAQARGWWEGERFRLMTKLTGSELETFFVKHYKPTPIFNPWGGRSGYFDGSSEKSARSVLEKIEQSDDPRFQLFRESIRVVRETLSETTGENKPETKEGAERLILALRNRIRGKSELWMASVSAVVGSGSGNDIIFPALFGTGGNEGSGSYTFAYMSAIDQCLIQRKWDHTISVVLFHSGAVANSQWEQSMGQFMPAGAATPWDLLFAFEGACLLHSAVSSRTNSTSSRWVSSPFFVAPASYGYSSGAELDEYALKNGKRMAGRGEQWFPLWNYPMLSGEMARMLIEGRATTNRERATDGWSMIRAISSMGVQRGIREFVRFGYQQRNNLATHFAVPLGRFRVPDHVHSNLACLDDLDAWLSRLRQQARSKEAPTRLKLVERRLADALFAVTQHPTEPGRWQTVLMCMGDVEAVLRTGSGFKAQPVPPLRPEWAAAANDGAPEFRLAVACALQSPDDPVRRHWLALAGERFAVSGTGGQARIQTGPEVVLHGRNGVDDAVALIERRLIEAGQRGERRLPLIAVRGASAHSSDLTRFIAGGVDVDRTMRLARALMAMGKRWRSDAHRLTVPDDDAYPDDAWLVIRLAMLPWRLRNDLLIGADPAVFRRLMGGDAATAVELALRRLQAAGVCTAVRIANTSPETARLWAAALAFPISKSTAVRFLRRIDPNYH